MEEYSKRKEIIKIIKNFRNQYQIYEYIKNNVSTELLKEEKFIEELINANPLVSIALEELKKIKIEDNIKIEIENKGIEAVIEEKEKLAIIPKEYKEQLFIIAKEYERKEEFEKAKIIYERIVEFGVTQVDKFNERYNREEEKKETTYYKAKYSYYICKIQNGEELTAEDREELKKLAKEDKNNILNLTKQGHMTDYELYEALFDDITLEKIEKEILPMIVENGNGHTHSKIYDPKDPIEYDKTLAPDKRLKFIKDNYDIESCKIGKGKLTGTIIFKIKDRNVVIVEKFFEVRGKKDDRTITASTGSATYFVHKDAQIDFESATKSKLVERKKGEKNASSLPLIDSANHLGDYYVRFKSKYETIEKNGESRRLMAGNIVGATTAINVQNSVDKEDTNETKEETKVVTKEISGEENIEEEVEDLSEYTIEDLVEYAQLLDEDLKRIEEELMVISEKIKENNKTKESIKETLRSEFSEDLSLAAKQESLKKDLDLLNELKKKLLELSRLKTKIIEEKNKNRTERNRVQEEFNNRILGE